MINYMTPSGDILTPTPTQPAQIIAPAAVADFLTVAGLPCYCINATAAPQLVSYDINLIDIYKYNENKIKKLLKMFNARFHTRATLAESAEADFSIMIERNPRADLYIKDCLYTAAFNNASRTSCALGVDTKNNPVILDLASAPHVLLAGTTGSGKSVLLNSIISSLLFKATPDTAQFIMIDPKKVELSLYGYLPHLVAPIVKDAAAAVEMLRAVCVEMTSRYNKLATAGVKQLADAPGMFPRLFVIIDELADLMLTSRHSVEESIIRIAQLGRAAGIHLIIATQRPTTNIITGLIKANIPCKISLAVSNTADSMTILNHGGAEKLTGRGDCILKRPDSIIETRLQAAYTPDIDIKRIINHYQ